MQRLSLLPALFSVTAFASPTQFEFTPFSSTAILSSADGTKEATLWFPFNAHPSSGKAQIPKAIPFGVVFCTEDSLESFKSITVRNEEGESASHFKVHPLDGGCTQINGLRFPAKGSFSGSIKTTRKTYPLSFDVRSALYYPNQNLEFSYAGKDSSKPHKYLYIHHFQDKSIICSNSTVRLVDLKIDSKKDITLAQLTLSPTNPLCSEFSESTSVKAGDQLKFRFADGQYGRIVFPKVRTF